ncbi:CAAD domain-containing protein [Chamaesiphon sp. OTE_8_metabat_110]|uniref:CAAD domain-containing protein n=1 Tax=Chamaesiphon sp. OTE_8_metabat_110 TaxID=2964696 RepID=UPI00286B37E2|nr:CAAD domain-containing protein [Chamaesiphon sp. OTE_8_metabat_110]
MKYDIALHELMRLDEYAEEESKAKAQDNANPNDGELAATDTAEAPTMSESPEIDIPSATAINYDEPPIIIAEEHAVVAAPVDTSADPIAASDVLLAPIALADTSGSEPKLDLAQVDTSADPISASDVLLAPIALADTSGSEPKLNFDEATNGSEDMPTTEEAIAAVRSTTATAKETVIEAAESTTDAAKETANHTVAAVADATEAVKETANDAVDAIKSTTDAAKETFETIQTEAPGIFDEVTSAVPAFFSQNRQLLINIGLIFLAFLVTKLAFAGINAIDDLPLVTPLLKVVGLFYVVKFIWNYLLREQDREKLVEKFNKTKAEVLGDR